ncbi:MAG: hypothetical protein F9K37_06185 [Bacteroidales bacterium]|nr:MAG: hypothetical protein F9K37_06185 [Bacteroidales bacterium]
MKTLISTFTLFFLFLGLISGQTVSLVLSGGGAKGLAHIGVIKALEENGVPISNVSGTSMGAIIGGLYSMGYSPDEMIALFKTRDFSNWSKGRIDNDLRYNINSFTNSDAENLSIGLSADKKGLKPKLFSSYIPTVGMDIAFEELCAQATAVSGGDFNRLFVPFRCNASDVVSKKMVYFRSGNLGLVIRSSMTFPMYFKPIFVDSVLLFDGGIYNNFLWRESFQEFNPDFIIGSKVASNSKQPSDEDPFQQVESMIVGLTDYSIPDSIGIVIDIPFQDVGLLDFEKVDEIVDAGYNATLTYIAILKQKVNTKVDIVEVDNRRKQFRASFPDMDIRNISVSGLNDKQKKYVSKLIFGKKETITFDKLKRDYYRLMSDRVFLRLFPTLVYNSNYNKFDVFVDAKLKRSVDVGVGLGLSSEVGNSGFLSANYSWLTRTSNTIYSNIYFGKFYNSARASFVKIFSTRIPLSLYSQVVANRFDYHSSNPIPFFEDTKPPYVIQSELFGTVGVRFSHTSAANYSAMISVGEKADDYYQIENYYSYDKPDRTIFKFIKSTLKYQKQTLNNKQFATRGRNQIVCFSLYSGEEIHSPGTTAPSILKSTQHHLFPTIYVHNESYHKLFRRRFWVGFSFDAYWSGQSFFNNYHATILSLNQYCPTSHSNSLFFQNYRNSRYVAAGLIPLFELSKSIHLRLELYLYQPVKVIDADVNNEPIWGGVLKNRWLISSGSFVYSSPIGPISATAAYYPSNGRNELYFSLSFGYSIFNPKVFEN